MAGTGEADWTDRAFLPKLMRNGRVLLLTGLGILAAGAVLTLLWPGVVAEYLLVWTGPGITLGGAFAYWYPRSEIAKHSTDRERSPARQDPRFRRAGERSR